MFSCRFLSLLFGLMLGATSHATEIIEPRGERSAEEKEKTQELAQTCYADAATHAPAMVAIRPGRFQLGSPENEAGRSVDEGPLHQVTIPRPFAISRCEITVGQFRQFVLQTKYQSTAEKNDKGCKVWNAETKQVEQLTERSWRNPGFAQNDHHPVVCISWEDAQAYVKWLSQRTGALYRLPTEAEWEYVARAGTTSARFYQDNKQCEYANGAGREAVSIVTPDWGVAKCSDSHVYTAPVASFAENQFGLFDMLGNVWEWTEDCWHDNYQGVPADGSAWKEVNDGDCSRRVVRSLSWDSIPRGLRSANRFGNSVDVANDIVGIRIARDF
jgi:formylglycine-generating enzyme required for sulfatase activity